MLTIVMIWLAIAMIAVTEIGFVVLVVTRLIDNKRRREFWSALRSALRSAKLIR